MDSRTLIIIPAYNEGQSIAPVIDNIRRDFPQGDILVVNDGSRDDTSEVAHQKTAFVLDLPYNSGIGAAVQTGFLFAFRNGYEVAIQVDGDGQHPANEIHKLTEALDEGWDVAIGSRFVRKTGYQSTFFRRLGNRIFSSLIHLVCGQKIHDTTSGFRAVNRQVISLFAQTYPGDYPEVEALVSLDKYDFRIKEIPVEMKARQGGRSSISFFDSAYYMIKVTLAVLITAIKRKDF
ncbi:MAG: glycosyltransferase family 2 protein [Deltaproteobacteria bacterium]|nr:glycosyltransferase family 2 protein [Deltaproteobacteria bacterium]